jgi:hypothetical protein
MYSKNHSAMSGFFVFEFHPLLVEEGWLKVGVVINYHLPLKGTPP